MPEAPEELSLSDLCAILRMELQPPGMSGLAVRFEAARRLEAMNQRIEELDNKNRSLQENLIDEMRSFRSALMAPFQAEEA